jgi:uncharacterized membrane protein YbaN (DUF454 family)
MRDLTDSPAEAPKPTARGLTRWLYVALGSVLVGVGVLGIFLPLLPSTIFFLGAAALYGKSSPAAHRWLTTNRWFGRHLRDFREQRGATIAAKAWAIVTLWIGIGVSQYLVGTPWLQLLLIAIGVAVTVHLVRLRTIRR